MELASMLAGEDFTDEPRCVCPVIAEFLRTYNDYVDGARRKDLYEFAALAVGTRAGYRKERERANDCLDLWAAGTGRRCRRVLWRLVPSLAARDIEVAHRSARWAADSADRHPAALLLVMHMCGRTPTGVPAGSPVAAPEARDLVTA